MNSNKDDTVLLYIHLALSLRERNIISNLKTRKMKYRRMVFAWNVI